MKEKYLTISVLIAVPEEAVETDANLELVQTMTDDAVQRLVTTLEGRIVNGNVNINVL